MAKTLVRVEVIWSAEVVREIRVRATPVRRTPAVLATPERPPLGPVLRATALLVPPLRHGAQVMVGRASRVTYKKQSEGYYGSTASSTRPANFRMCFAL